MATPLPSPDFSEILNKVFYKVAEDLTYGVVKDIETLILAGISIGLILLGARLIFKYFDFKIDTRVASENFKSASDYADKRDSYATGTAGYDYYNALYKQDLNKALSYSKKYEKETISIEPYKPKPVPFVFVDGSSPEKPSFSAESDWESASLTGEGYVGFAGSEVEDAEYADRSDWTSVQEPDITGLEVDSSSSFSSERSDWTAMQEPDITGLEVESSSGSVDSGRSDWTAFQNEEIGDLRLENPEDRMHHVLDNFSNFSDGEVFSAIDGLDGHSSSLSDWTSFQEPDITVLEMESSSFSASERSDWTAINDISFEDSRFQIVSSSYYSEDPGPADTDHPGWV